jgi:hypothetical protein
MSRAILYSSSGSLVACYRVHFNNNNNNNNNNIYLLQIGCHPVAVITLHVFPNTDNKFT